MGYIVRPDDAESVPLVINGSSAGTVFGSQAGYCIFPEGKKSNVRNAYSFTENMLCNKGVI